jgi:Clp amino terminal domain, pathogenicity island component
MLPLGFRCSWLGTEHLLLGVASPTGNPAGQVLSNLGMTVASAGQALLEELGPPPAVSSWVTGTSVAREVYEILA